MTIGKMERDGLIAGDYPLKAEQVTVQGPATEGAATEFKRGDVVGLGPDNVPALVDSSADDGTETPVGIMCDDVTAGVGEQVVTTMYIKGEFNQRALRFGGSDTAATHIRRMTEIGLLVRETRI